MQRFERLGTTTFQTITIAILITHIVITFDTIPFIRAYAPIVLRGMLYHHHHHHHRHHFCYNSFHTGLCSDCIWGMLRRPPEFISRTPKFRQQKWVNVSYNMHMKKCNFSSDWAPPPFRPSPLASSSPTSSSLLLQFLSYRLMFLLYCVHAATTTGIQIANSEILTTQKGQLSL